MRKRGVKFERCPQCNGTELERDEENKEISCKNCGLVLGYIVSTAPENWEKEDWPDFLNEIGIALEELEETEERSEDVEKQEVREVKEESSYEFIIGYSKSKVGIGKEIDRLERKGFFLAMMSTCYDPDKKDEIITILMKRGVKRG